MHKDHQAALFVVSQLQIQLVDQKYLKNNYICIDHIQIFVFIP
jgi:hypothetical protein